MDTIQALAAELKGGRGFRGWFKRFFFAERNKDTLTKMDERLKNAVEMFGVRDHADHSLSTQELIFEKVAAQGAIANAVHRVEHMAITAGMSNVTEYCTRLICVAEYTDEQRTIDSIPHADAGYLAVKEVKAGFMAGTRNETFTTLGAWTGPGYPADDPKPFLLLTAGAGVGKSAVAHQLCVRITDPTQLGLNLGASFFFARGGIDSAHAFFSTIAYQLALSQPSLRPAILDAARVFLAGGKEQQMRHTFEQLLLNPLAGYKGCAVFNVTTFIIIDGLDECKDRELVPGLIRCLLELVGRLPWLRVFLATRPEPHILPVLTSQSVADIVHHKQLDNPQTMDESRKGVELYLRQTIPEIHPYGDFVRAHPNMLDRLVERAHGLFIYARTAINYLETIDTRPEEQFALLLSTNGAGLSPLDQLYLQILQSAFPPSNLQDSSAMHTRVHNFLTFIALRHRSLPPAAIALLLTLTDDDVLWMAGRLRAVLLVNEDRNLVPLHATFAEFLVDSKRCIDALYHVDPPPGHALLARKCFASYNVDTMSLYLRSKSGSHMNSQASVDPDAINSEMSYVIGWDNHFDALKHGDELRQELHAILQIQPLMTRLYNIVHVDLKTITSYVQACMHIEILHSGKLTAVNRTRKRQQQFALSM